MAGLGDTFRLADSKDAVAHLWIIITDPQKNDGDVLAVNLTTLRDHTEDESCVLDKGDHPFIRHKTAVNYGDARRWRISKINQALEEGKLLMDRPVTPGVLRKILKGAKESKFLREHSKRLLP